MDLITTHVNADFDGLGSLVAAKKLYPNSRLMLPGSQEEAVRKFLSLAKESVVVETEKECPFEDVTRLILVDTRHKSRIGVAAELVDRGVETVIYDHHPHMKGDIVADKDISEEVGATVTIFADILKKKHIKLTPLEATIMLIGIYEETGSLTYRTTTKLDVDMVSFLLSQGANLSVVSSYINRELTEGELSLLTKLISSTERISLKGITVSLVQLEGAGYSGELGMLIHKLMDIENIHVLFVLVDTKRGRIDIIGRSSIPGVDINKILSHFGGGGHATAGAAKVHGAMLETVREKLIKALKSNIRVRFYARDIMSRDVKALNVDERVDSAKAMLLKEKLEAAPVMDKGRLKGVITLTGLNKAIRRGFSHSRIKGYMSQIKTTVKPDTPLHVIQKIMFEEDRGIVPVLKNRKLAGVIKRSSILKNVHSGLFMKPRMPHAEVISNLSKKMVLLLPPEIIKLLKLIGHLAESSGCQAFVVGGLVRDLLLGTENLDLDIVTEGEAIKLGHALAKELSASIVVHKRFGTCSVITRDRLKIDIATARKETYERPAALPTVEFSSLKDDLIRRDFTINAMAISLSKNSFGQLVDFFGGENDLVARSIRVLHDGSFIDDPTRIFRAVRFETRLGFTIEKHTGGLIKTAIKKEMFEKVEPQRIRDELILILKEPERLKALKRMAELDELRFLHPKIKLDAGMASLFRALHEACAWYNGQEFKKRALDEWLIYLVALFDQLSYNNTLAICRKFVFRRGDNLRILSYKESSRSVIKALAVPGNMPPSRVYNLLEPLSFEVILLIMAKSGSMRVRSRIKDFFKSHSGVRISIKGDDIKAMGLKPGPRFKAILAKVLEEKLDGNLKTRQDELRFAAGMITKV